LKAVTHKRGNIGVSSAGQPEKKGLEKKKAKSFAVKKKIERKIKQSCPRKIKKVEAVVLGLPRGASVKGETLGDLGSPKTYACCGTASLGRYGTARQEKQ